MTKQAYFLPKWVLTPQKKTIFSKIDIFSKFLGEVGPTWSGKINVKKIKMIAKQKNDLKFVLFSSPQSLLLTIVCKLQSSFFQTLPQHDISK